MTFNGFVVQDAGEYKPVQNFILIGWGSIGQLVLDALSTNNINRLIAEREFPSIRSVSGGGVLATGWEFPNSVMANGVPFISANTGLPSIKLGGIVEPFPAP